MYFGVIKGTVVCSQKAQALHGYSLKVLLPSDEKGMLSKEAPVVALDDIGSRAGDLVSWIDKREASMAMDGATVANSFPIDAAITGIVDDTR